MEEPAAFPSASANHWSHPVQGASAMMKRKGSLTDSDGVERPVGPDPSRRVGVAVLCVASVIAAVLIVKQGSMQVARSRVAPTELVPAAQTQSLATVPVLAEGKAASPEQTQDDGRSTRLVIAAPNPDVDLWNSVHESTDPATLERYLARYPGGRFADVARQRITELRLQQRLVADVDRLRGNDVPKPESPEVAVIAPPPAAPVVAPPPSDTGELARSLQRELKRVGCLNGETDGVWGEQSRSALRNFARRSKLEVEGDEPSVALLDAATAARSRICPLVCGEDEHEINGRCVDWVPPAQERAHQTDSRDHSRQRVERPRGEREPAEAPRGGQKLCFGPERGGPLVACK